ncbi:MAG: glycosyltransferase family protein [Lentisphaeraceae bacterium]|nr:glycosyltransferase family protein [Lentisphaeraceae bacterium]
MKFLAIIQARLSSTRLPGKVLKKILGKSLIEHQLSRVKRSKYIEKIVVATSDAHEDGAIEDVCLKLGVSCFRGSLDNVLERFYGAALEYKPEHVIRLTGDCPLSDPEVIDDLVQYYLERDCDYAANCVKAHYPDGLDAEVFSFKVLEETYNNAQMPSQLEHVTPYIRECGLYRIAHYEPEFDYSHLRWTVDEPEDFILVKNIFESLFPKDENFSWYDVLELLANNKELGKINRQFQRNEGYLKSIEKEQSLKERNESD